MKKSIASKKKEIASVVSLIAELQKSRSEVETKLQEMEDEFNENGLEDCDDLMEIEVFFFLAKNVSSLDYDIFYDLGHSRTYRSAPTPNFKMEKRVTGNWTIRIT